MNKILLIGITVGILFLAGCATNQAGDDVVLDKENNICATDSDCEYIWYTGGCNTPEYVGKEQQEALDQGIFIQEVPRREGVTCSCENNKCVTHG